MYVDIELDRIIMEATHRKVSDVHFESTKEAWLVRFRQDGVLQEVGRIEAPYGEAMLNRIKVLSGMDISEKRIPQDGRWDWQAGPHHVTMRVASLPSIQGETIVCRIMGNEGSHKSLVDLGMDKNMFSLVQQTLQQPHGLFLISGPTGSGKTATLYAMLRLLPLHTTKLICLEDPVEATIPGAIQVNVNEKIGFTFAKGLRAILRQDPDTIMIGEIRDNETAHLAVQAALTGHRVLSTIHTNTAAGVMERLQDMGIEPYLIKATVLGALAQRLVRKVRDDDPSMYEGRTALYELFLRHGVAEYVSTLEEAAVEAITKGVTTREEVQRIGLCLPRLGPYTT